MPAAATWVQELTPEELDTDPYPAYARMRSEEPIAFVPWAELYFVTRWDDCLAIGTDQENFRGAYNHATLNRVFGSPNVLTSVDPEHRDIRMSIDPPLRPRAVNGYIDELVRPIARQALHDISEQGESELMGELFEPVSVRALGELLGLGVEPEVLRDWFHRLNVGVSNVESDPAKFEISDATTAEIVEAITPRMEQLNREPDESMLSHMIHGGRQPGDSRPLEQVLPSLLVLLLGGMQEPGHGAGTTLLGLMSRPDQLARVANDPSLIPTAVTEGLRWIAPIGAVERQAARDIEVGGVKFSEGDIIEIILGSANRDETRYPDPDAFDIDRERLSHMAFGNGEHFCSGHFFSRQLERIVLEELFLRLPALRQDPDREPVVRGWAFRAPKKLYARWDA